MPVSATLLARHMEQVDLPLGFAGGLTDKDTGLIHFGFREYLPDVARWNRPDPLGKAGGDPDVYGYCLDDPINTTDKNGLWTFDVGIDGSLSGFGFGVGGRVFAGMDDDFNFRWGYSKDKNASSGFGGGLEAGVKFTTADKMDDLAGTAQTEKTGVGPVSVATEHNDAYDSLYLGAKLKARVGKKFIKGVEKISKLDRIPNFSDIKKTAVPFFVETGPSETVIKKFK